MRCVTPWSQCTASGGGGSELAPGHYQVVCRVHDDSKPSGQQWPWVLKDDAELLHSERVWWIVVPPR